MPPKFKKCVASGGKVRTVKPKGPKSKTCQHVCRTKSGKRVKGHVKTRKS